MEGVRDACGNFHIFQKRQPEAQRYPLKAEVFEAQACHSEQLRSRELPAINMPLMGKHWVSGAGH